jgi:hypothetical protein
MTLNAAGSTSPVVRPLQSAVLVLIAAGSFHLAFAHSALSGLVLVYLEYGMPLFRVASSGISQLIDARGVERATARVPGSGELIAGRLEVRQGASGVPWDSWLAPACTVVCGGLAVFLAVPRGRRRADPGMVPPVTPPPAS